MAQGTCFFLSWCLLIISLSVCSSGKIPYTFKEAAPSYAHKEQKSLSPLIQHDETYPPITTLPMPPVTILPSPPTIVTVPSTNPVVILTPNADTFTTPLPITNPVTTYPSTATPVTNPVTTYPSPTTGVPAVTPVTNPPAAGGGQSWCVARIGVPEADIQAALDYACGIGGADCSAIQKGASCENPDSLQSHASYAFNSYYQKNPIQTSCDFGGCGMITTTNPSTGTCVYPTSSSQISSPLTATTPSPMTTTPSPTTTSTGGGAIPGFVTPPSLLNSNNPSSVDGTLGFGDESPPNFNSSTSMSISFQPIIGFIILAICTVAGRFIVDM